MIQKSVAATGLSLALVVGQVAQAQWLGPAWETTTTLTSEDMEMMRTTVQRDIHGKAVNTAATWQNPASGNSGMITLLKKLTRNGKSCEQIGYQIRAARPAGNVERYVFTSCLQPDGQWMLEH